MPDILDRDGLRVKSLTEIRTELETAYREIYGTDINLDQNSPDGQILNIYAQASVDVRELLLQAFASFDPDQAEGRILDQRVVINGITRKGGSFTTVNVSVTTNRALNLVGLDSQANEASPDVPGLYTLRDGAGNLFFLVDSQSVASAGTYSYLFRASEIGSIEVGANSITTAVTFIPGVTEVNNPSGAITQGQNEEPDATLRQRRRISTAIGSIGNIDGLQAAISDLSGVTTAIVRENFGTTTDSEGTPAHTIWAIVEGGSNTEIATVIKSRKTSGAGMRGDVEVDIPYIDGRPYIVKFDRPVSEDLYVRFNLALPGGVFDEDEVKRQIVEGVIWEVGQDATSDTLIAFIKGLNSKYQITGMEVSDDDSTWLEVVSPASVQNRFVMDVLRITIS